MASGVRSLDTDILQIRQLYAKTPQNAVIPSTHILIAGGDGSTYWNSVSTIFPVSSFKTVYGNSGPRFSADVNFNTLKVSTTGIQGLFESYIDPATSTLMLSNVLPASVVNLGSVQTVNTIQATTVPTPQQLLPVSGQSTIKYFGVGDILLSTINTQNAVFFSISSFTSAGYSTISGETFKWRPTLASTISTISGLPSFISSIPFNATWNWGSNLAMSTVETSPTYTTGDLYFSTLSFTANNFLPYMTTSTKMFVEMKPSYFFSSMVVQADSNLVKPISTFVQGPSGYKFGESLITSYVTSQVPTLASVGLANGLEGSNYFSNSLMLQLNSSNVSTICAQALPLSTVLTVYHCMPGAVNYSGRSGFNGAVTPEFTNITSKTGGLYLHLYNQAPATLSV
jgi:hypothetical protein